MVYRTGMARKRELPFPSVLHFLILLTQHCTANDRLTQSKQLSVNQSLVSAGEIFELGFFSPPGNSRKLYVGMWYRNIPVRRILWVANRENPLAANDSASSLKIGSDGNLRLVDGEKSTVWSTDVSIKSSNHTVAVLTDKGQFILKDNFSGLVFWDSQFYPGDTVSAGTGMNHLGYNTRTGEKQQLLSWKADNDPSPGEFTLQLSEEAPPQAFVWINNSKPYWRGGPWNGMQFIGIPDEDPGYSNWISLVQNNQQGTAYVRFNTFNMSLEIVSGRRNCGFNIHEEHLSLLHYAWKLWMESREVDLIDDSITNTCSFTEALRCIRIGLLCVQDHASDRPTMPNVVLMLCSETEIPQPKQPRFTIFQSLLDSDSKSHSSRNGISVSLTEAR